jgi:hypothetical protein
MRESESERVGNSFYLHFLLFCCNFPRGHSPRGTKKKVYIEKEVRERERQSNVNTCLSFILYVKEAWVPSDKELNLVFASMKRRRIPC